jgi:hypothetical protein
MAVAAAVIVLGGLALLARDRLRRSNAATLAATSAAAEARRALAAADFALGRARIDAGFPEEAPPHLLAALEGDPRHPDARRLLLETLGRPGWSFPALTLRHPGPPRAIAFGTTPDTLFSAFDADADGDGAVLRWDLATATIQAVFLPPRDAIVRSLSPAPAGKRLLVRFAPPLDPVVCDAKTLRVVARLPLPAREGIGAGCFAWSPDAGSNPVWVGFLGCGPEFNYCFTDFRDGQRGFDSYWLRGGSCLWLRVEAAAFFFYSQSTPGYWRLVRCQ